MLTPVAGEAAVSRLVLASSSPYRRMLLERLGLEFEVRVPDVDESARSGETPEALAARLAESKARAVAESGIVSPCVVIGSDQVPSRAGSILRKPGDHATALAQLVACQSAPVSFLTALHVIDDNGRSWSHLDRTVVTFRQRSKAELDRYLRIEQPYDCAGGFKAEGLGIALFESIESNDPTALIGLPLIAVSRILSEAGMDPLDPASPAPATAG